MSTEAIIQILLTIIGVLITALITVFIGAIRYDIAQLKDMFVRHVRNHQIHVNMGKTEGE